MFLNAQTNSWNLNKFFWMKMHMLTIPSLKNVLTYVVQTKSNIKK